VAHSRIQGNLGEKEKKEGGRNEKGFKSIRKEGQKK